MGFLNLSLIVLEDTFRSHATLGLKQCLVVMGALVFLFRLNILICVLVVILLLFICLLLIKIVVSKIIIFFIAVVLLWMPLLDRRCHSFQELLVSRGSVTVIGLSFIPLFLVEVLSWVYLFVDYTLQELSE